MDRSTLISNIQFPDRINFEQSAIELFRYQYDKNPVYHSWVSSLNIDAMKVDSIEQIPFLPISAFKNYDVMSGDRPTVKVFTSSGTTGSAPSRHIVTDIDLYLDNATRIFESFYGEVKDWCFLALLPNYLERKGSSLISMVQQFIEISKFQESGFYLYDHAKLAEQLRHSKEKKIPTVLFGVSFALLDFLDEHQLVFPELVIMETGGMKGRKKEMTKRQLQDIIASGFGVSKVHSEYGMTELFSQAYSKADGLFYPGHSMRMFTKEITDPFYDAPLGKSGVINVVDLANIDSCGFIETQDLGRLFKDGSFEVLGRLDAADIRGCNLMVSDL